MWRATAGRKKKTPRKSISIHALRVEGDHSTYKQGDQRNISIHALRVEGDNPYDVTTADQLIFLSTPSVWRATQQAVHDTGNQCDFYPRPPCGGRPRRAECSQPWNGISIHALRVEGDHYDRSGRRAACDFYPRPPCGGRRRTATRSSCGLKLFLSTPSVWRATCIDLRNGKITQFLSTPSVWRATVANNLKQAATTEFLSTPSVWRATDSEPTVWRIRKVFLSTPSVWRATAVCRAAGRDNPYFYPRPPCGGRHSQPLHSFRPGQFLSTPSVWRATAHLRTCSIGALRFLSTPSVWRATLSGRRTLWRNHISIHALRVEGDTYL